MSYFGFRVYGKGHLADSIRCGLYAKLLRDDSAFLGDNILAFVAQDVLDHSDKAQLSAVHDLYEKAYRSHKYVVVVSQVPPGWMRAHTTSDCFYQVDTIIVCSAVERVVRPAQIIVGCYKPDEPLPLIYQEYLAAHACPVLQMSWESAELAKCAINYFLAAQVRTTNELAKAARRTQADWSDVAKVLAGDARIGPHAYLRPGNTNQHLDRDVDTINKLIGLG